MKLFNKIGAIYTDFAEWYFSKRTLPYWCIIILDSICVYLSLFITYWAFMGLSVVAANFWPLLVVSTCFVLVCLVFFRVFHTYSGIVRFSSFVDLMKIGWAMLCSLVVCIGLHYITNNLNDRLFAEFQSKHIVIAFVGATILMWGVRLIVKMLYDNYFMLDKAKKVFIYGVLDGGVGLAKNIRNEKPAKFYLKGFISHDKTLKYTRLLGKRVYEVNENLPEILKREGIDAVLVAPKRNELFRNDQALQDYIVNAGVQIYMAKDPVSYDSGESGQVSSNSLVEVNIEDLLPRQQIEVDMEAIGKILTGKRIMVTGSAGSIGSEIARQVAKYKPADLILIDQAETPQHDMRLQMKDEYPDVKCETIVTSIDSVHRMRRIFEEYRPEYVFHAAAYKHVPMMEDNPCTAVHNNIRGTKRIADLAVEYGVKKFVMISTDKAVNPTNVMGCSKRICEIYCQSLNKAQQEGKVKGSTEFVTTRFGNVLGSNGSVIPIFKKQIAAGGPVTVTDPNIIRFFMLIPEACKLVLEAGAKGNGGEIFVFDMGAPVKIADLAKRMIKLSHAKNVEIKYTGLRDGEKLYEEVLNEKETTKPSFHEKIRIASVREYDYAEVEKDIEEIMTIADTYDMMKTVAKMKQIVPEYKSKHSVYEVLDK